jgi:hypothetical protein
MQTHEQNRINGCKFVHMKSGLRSFLVAGLVLACFVGNVRAQNRPGVLLRMEAVAPAFNPAVAGQRGGLHAAIINTNEAIHREGFAKTFHAITDGALTAENKRWQIGLGANLFADLIGSALYVNSFGGGMVSLAYRFTPQHRLAIGGGLGLRHIDVWRDDRLENRATHEPHHPDYLPYSALVSTVGLSYRYRRWEAGISLQDLGALGLSGKQGFYSTTNNLHTCKTTVNATLHGHVRLSPDEEHGWSVEPFAWYRQFQTYSDERQRSYFELEALVYRKHNTTAETHHWEAFLGPIPS